MGILYNFHLTILNKIYAKKFVETDEFVYKIKKKDI